MKNIHFISQTKHLRSLFTWFYGLWGKILMAKKNVPQKDSNLEWRYFRKLYIETQQRSFKKIYQFSFLKTTPKLQKMCFCGVKYIYGSVKNWSCRFFLCFLKNMKFHSSEKTSHLKKYFFLHTCLGTLWVFICQFLGKELQYSDFEKKIEKK